MSSVTAGSHPYFSTADVFGCEVGLKNNSVSTNKGGGICCQSNSLPFTGTTLGLSAAVLCTCRPRSVASADWPWALTTRTLDSRAACICPILMCAMTEVTPTWISTTCVRNRQNKISDYWLLKSSIYLHSLNKNCRSYGSQPIYLTTADDFIQSLWVRTTIPDKCLLVLTQTVSVHGGVCMA